MMKLYNTLLFFIIIMCGSSLSYATKNSVLSKGKWIKLGVTERGVYGISYQNMIDYGFDPNSINPSRIAIYGTTNKSLPELNSVYRIDDLEEMAIYVKGESDGTFDKDDAIIFYGEGCKAFDYDPGLGKIKYSHNIYSDTVYYFLTVKDEGEGKRWYSRKNSNSNYSNTITKFKDCIAHEIDSVNLSQYGREWLGEVVEKGSRRRLSFDVEDAVMGSIADVSIDIATGNNNTDGVFNININEIEDTIKVKKILGEYTIYEIYKKTFSNEIYKPYIDILLGYETGAKGYLDRIIIEVERNIKYNGNGTYFFYETGINGKDNKVVVEYASTDDFMLLDITDPLNVENIEYEKTNGQVSFILKSDRARSFAVYDNYAEPIFVENVDNQNLHNVEPVNLVIVSHPLFLDEANRLASFKRNIEGLSVLVVTQKEIFNEYSGGKQDPTGIRMFLKDMNKDPKTLRYLLLFGDGSYDCKGRVEPNTNYVITYQSEATNNISTTFQCEDYFGIFGENSGENSIGKTSVGVGRFPVRTVKDAKVVVDKVIRYSDKESNVGNWINRYLFMADDGDGNGHLYDSNVTSELVEKLNGNININKLFSASYDKKITGGLLPVVNQKMKDCMDDGVLLINYFGHAGETGWSDEKILVNNDVFKWHNDKLPIIISASCQFGRFDTPSMTSTGEYTFLRENGGTIATITSTRLAYPSNNRRFCEAFHTAMLTGKYDYEPRLGDFFKDGKNNSGEANRQIAMFGDPSINIPMPKRYEIIVDSINNVPSNKDIYVKALDEVKMSGYIVDKENGSIPNWWDGIISTTVYDKVRKSTTIEDPNSTYTFNVQNEQIFVGNANVSKGRFCITFKIPKEINYNVGQSRISLYSYDSIAFNQASGYYTKMNVGDIDVVALNEAAPPKIDMLINGTKQTSFVVNYNTGQKLELYYEISDQTGLFVEKSNNSKETVIMLDDEYIDIDKLIYDNGVFTKTWGRYILPELSEGTHSITIKSYNIANISSEETYTFEVVYDSRELTIANAILYPNPADRHSKTTLSFDIIDSIDDVIEVEVSIYNMNGTIVKQFRQDVLDYSYSLSWDNSDLSAGLYLYRINTKNKKGDIATGSYKQIIR